MNADRLLPRIAAAAVMAMAAGELAAQSIYTCTDSRGRKLTSDRPIAECVDREQFELNPSGTIKRRIGPSLTAQERAAQEARERQLAEERARQLDEKRRDRALLIRYPNRATHDAERREALTMVDEVIKSARKRVVDLQRQLVAIEAEMEFYKKDPSKAPASLKRQIEENAQNTDAQNRFIVLQDEEKKRINARFDEELQRLQMLWAQAGTAASALAPAAPAAAPPPRTTP